MKKKQKHASSRRESLTQLEVLKIIKEQNRNMKAAAEFIAEEYFMKTPADELPTQDLAEMNATIKRMSLKLGEFIWSESFF